MEEYILPHIDQFFHIASGKQLYQGADKCWMADVSKWSNYLTFDIMGDLVFGKDFGMVCGKENVEIPSVIDAALHRQLLVTDPPFLLIHLRF
jgi:hypothetical protein